MIPIVKSPQYERDMMEIWDQRALHGRRNVTPEQFHD